MNEDQARSLKDAFNLFDTEKTGKIQVKDLMKLLRYIGYNITEDEIDQLINNRDKDAPNEIEFIDFMIMVSTKLNVATLASEAQIAETFKTFDRDNDGYITADEFKVTLGSLGEELNDETIKEMIDEVDLNGDGKVDYKEFTAMMLAK